MVQRPLYHLAEDWMILVFTASLLILTWGKLRSFTRFSRTFSAAVNIRIMRQVAREETSLVRHHLLQTLVFVALSSLIIYLILAYYQITIPYLSGALLWVSLCLAMAMVYFGKTGVIAIVRHLAGGDFGLEEYQFNVFLVLRIFGVVLLPAAVLMAYLPVQWFPMALISIAILAASAFLFRLGRGVVNSLRLGISPFYIFFYICTLEILPLLVVYRALQS
ncbi:MAG: hypothetical protein RL220_11 [Bacteroidota bacterium]|jgi:hypothetical protein